MIHLKTFLAFQVNRDIYIYHDINLPFLGEKSQNRNVQRKTSESGERVRKTINQISFDIEYHMIVALAPYVVSVSPYFASYHLNTASYSSLCVSLRMVRYWCVAYDFNSITLQSHSCMSAQSELLVNLHQTVSSERRSKKPTSLHLRQQKEFSILTEYNYIGSLALMLQHTGSVSIDHGHLLRYIT